MKTLRLACIIMTMGFMAACGQGGYQAFNADELNNDLGTIAANPQVAEVQSVSDKTFNQVESLLSEAQDAVAQLEAAKTQAEPSLNSLNQVKGVLDNVVAPVEENLKKAQDILAKLKLIVDQVGSAFPNAGDKLTKISDKIGQFQGFISNVLGQIGNGKSLLTVIMDQVLAKIDTFIKNPTLAAIVKMVAQLIMAKLTGGI